MKKKHNLQIAITHVHTHVHPLVEVLALLHVVVVVRTHVKGRVRVTHHAHVVIVVLGLANLDAEMLVLILVKQDVQEPVVRNAETIVGEHAQQVVIMAAQEGIGFNI